ncbi:MAG: thioredoxin domain-containing protein [Chitinispirillaceae bacterium]|jgi:thioredoxin 1
MNKKTVMLFVSTILAVGLLTIAGGQWGPMTRLGGEVADSSEAIAQKIIDSKTPVFIDFWAIWCGPCRMLNPTIRKLEDEYKSRVLFLKVNVDYNPRISSYFQVQGIPAVFILNDRTVVQQMVGLRPEADYRTALNAVLSLPSAKDSTKSLPDTMKEKKSSGKKHDNSL